jgi:hypothetical protein
VSKCGEIIQYLKRKKNLISSLKKRENFKRKFLFEFLKLKFCKISPQKSESLVLNLDCFKCLNSLDLMKDPIIVATGQVGFWTGTIALDPTFGSFTLLESVSQ